MTLMNDNKPHCDHPQLSCHRPSENWFVSLFTLGMYMMLYLCQLDIIQGEKHELIIFLSVKDQCIVLFPYTAQNEDELSLLEGQVRLVCSRHLR